MATKNQRCKKCKHWGQNDIDRKTFQTKGTGDPILLRRCLNPKFVNVRIGLGKKEVPMDTMLVMHSKSRRKRIFTHAKFVCGLFEQG